MAQVKVYGTSERLSGRINRMSDVIHACLVEAFGLPEEKRFQRFFALSPREFRFPADRSADYTIVEILLFEGRSIPAKKHLYELLYGQFKTQLAITPLDLEIVLIQTPRHDWGIRGQPGDELTLPYNVDG